MSDWRDNLVTSPEDIARVVRENTRIAVLGIKSADRTAVRKSLRACI